ncbi:nucleoside deaminase [Paramicrobacterium agarici]|uniref:Cytidine/deoxycytidylate deaminase-like protein n=1 Tax=Paramicrobacterium agarici TaxID=630514 RepID=A0A2A9DSG1_9MICO|nr:nucleoside deaminase [Microbacterium agarici]PFG29618.1 cytidine/deoxycytidylate deaminase-like protein [Microbacterium agarici]
MSHNAVPSHDGGDLTELDRRHLARCVELACEALDAGDEPFGSVLVDAVGSVRFEDRNHVVESGDRTQHPEFAIARWAAEHMTPDERRDAVVYTSGEHCPMCSAAHAWVGLGRIVFASSTDQLVGWLADWGVPGGPVAPYPITEIAPFVPVTGPAPEFADEIKQLHARLHGVNVD